MDIREEKHGNVCIVVLREKLDASASPALEKTMQDILDRGENRIVLDFSGLTYISSLGLRALIIVAKNLQKTNGRLALAALNENIYGVFKIAGFTRVFSIYSTREEAVTSCAN